MVSARGFLRALARDFRAFVLGGYGAPVSPATFRRRLQPPPAGRPAPVPWPKIVGASRTAGSIPIVPGWFLGGPRDGQPVPQKALAWEEVRTTDRMGNRVVYRPEVILEARPDIIGGVAGVVYMVAPGFRWNRGTVER